MRAAAVALIAIALASSTLFLNPYDRVPARVFLMSLISKKSKIFSASILFFTSSFCPPKIQ